MGHEPAGEGKGGRQTGRDGGRGVIDPHVGFSAAQCQEPFSDPG